MVKLEFQLSLGQEWYPARTSQAGTIEGYDKNMSHTSSTQSQAWARIGLKLKIGMIRDRAWLGTYKK